MLLFYCNKLKQNVDNKTKICYHIIKLRENKHTGGKQNEKFNESRRKNN